MSGQKQSFRFRLPWLPSLVSAPVPPARRLSSKQRSRKTSPPPPPPPTNDIMSVIPVQRQVESPAQSIQPLAETEPQTQLPETESQTQQPLTQDAMLHSRIDSQLPSEGLEVAPRKEPTVFQNILVSGTDSIPLQPSQGPESQPLAETDARPPPTGESKPHSNSQGTLLIRTKSQSQSPSSSTPTTSPSPSPSSSSSTPTPSSSTTSPTRAKSQSRTSSQTSIPTRTKSTSSSPSNAGNYTQSTVKQPSPSRAATHPRLAQSRAVKSAKTSSKSPSPPFSPSLQSSSSYSNGESSSSSNQQQAWSPKNSPSQHKQNPKSETYSSQEYEQKPTITIEQDTTNSSFSEAIKENESHTPMVVYDKMEPKPSQALKMKDVIETGFTQHPSTGEGRDTDETEEDKSHHWSARNKGKRTLFTKRVSPSSLDSGYIPLQKETKDDVSNLIQKLSTGKLGQPRSDDPVSIITISGNNKGATLHLGSALLGKAPRHMAYKSDPENEVKTTSDGEGKYPGTTHEHQSNKTYVNSNIQGINNSMLLSSSVYERNPGVHFGPLGKNGFLPEANRKEAVSYEAAHKTQVNGTTAGNVAHQPIIRRRCLRGLFMESSESEPDNPGKPRRHGCRYACGDKGKFDF